MNIIPSPERSLSDTKSRYIDQNLALEQRYQEIYSSRSSENTSLSEVQRKTLEDISYEIDGSVTDLIHSTSDNTSLFDNINSSDNGLDDNQKNVLTEALNGVQKSWMTFMDTVATVFGVKTEPVTT
jgi:hypothetical protein